MAKIVKRLLFRPALEAGGVIQCGDELLVSRASARR